MEEKQLRKQDEKGRKKDIIKNGEKKCMGKNKERKHKQRKENMRAGKRKGWIKKNHKEKRKDE